MSLSTGNKSKGFLARTLYAAGLGVALVPSFASALNLEEVTLTSDPSDVIVTVRADEPLTTPLVKSYEGEVRIRFPASHVARTHQVHGDGRALQMIELRPGSHDTTVLRFDLGDETRLSEGDVRVEQRKGATVFRIARDLLPPMRELAPVAEPAAQKPSAPVAKREPAAPAQKPLAALPSAPSKPSPAAQPSVTKPSLSNALAQGASPMPMLLMISSLLGLAYMALRVFMRKQVVVSEHPTIEVVAQKRIGARHQLVIVRAFGQDHLLSIQGTTTTPIASNEVGEEGVSLDSATRLLAERNEEPAAPREDLRDESRELAREHARELTRENAREEARENTREHTREHARADTTQPTRIDSRQRSSDVSRDESGMFGGELLRLAIAQKQRSSMAPAPASQRDSGASQSRERMVQAPQAAQPQAAPSGRPPRRDDQALSKAVAGLVRLRREVR
jgi:hypothetical protein